MGTPFDRDQMRNQSYPPEYIAHVKEEHSRQTPLTAESLMVIAHETSKYGGELATIPPRVERMRATIKAGVPDQALRDAMPILLEGHQLVCSQLAHTCQLIATLASEMARMKLERIKIE